MVLLITETMLTQHIGVLVCMKHSESVVTIVNEEVVLCFSNINQFSIKLFLLRNTETYSDILLSYQMKLHKCFATQLTHTIQQLFNYYFCIVLCFINTCYIKTIIRYNI